LTAYSQWSPDIITESDWEYYYLNGTIDYNSYQLLREIPEGEAIIDTADYIVSTLGVSSVELEENYGVLMPEVSPGRKPFLNRMPIFYAGRVRFGSKVVENKSENYLFTSLQSEDFRVDFKLRDEQNRVVAERRSVAVHKEPWSVVLGNFTADIGCGLVIGKFDYRPVSYGPQGSDFDRFLFPDNSLYNGVSATVRGDYRFIYSAKEYGESNKRVLGLAFSAGIYSLRIGITGVLTRLSGASRRRDFGAGSLYIDMPESGTKAELAYAESGIGAAVQTVLSDFTVRGWYYDDSYLNLQSSGFAHPDYQAYSYDISEISFRQAQSGESGFYLRKDLEIEDLEIISAAEFWRNPRSDKINYDGLILSRYHFSNGFSPYARCTFYDRNDYYSNRIEWGGIISKSFTLDSRLALTYRNKSIENGNSRFYILISLPLLQNMSLAGRVRWHFDGSYDYFLEERLIFFEDLTFKATYRWQDDLGKDLGSLYIILENRF
jgi:hypothetical protein